MKKQIFNLCVATVNPKPMRIAFLDIDGVLLDPKEIPEDFKKAFLKAIKDGDTVTLKTKGVDRFSHDALKLLQELIEASLRDGFSFGIVISSSWRAHLSLDQFKELVKDHMFAKYIIGKTADHTDTLISFSDKLSPYKFTLNRGELVETWLKTYSEAYNVVNFCVLDDQDDKNCFSELLPDYFVHCKKGVFSKEDSERSLQILNTRRHASIERPLNDFRVLQVPLDSTRTNRKTFERVPIPISDRRRHQMLTPLFDLYLCSENGAIVKEIFDFDCSESLSAISNEC